MIKRETEKDKMPIQIMITCRHISAIWPEIDTLFLPFFEDIQIRVSDSKLNISTNSEPKSDIYISKCKFGYRQHKTNPIFEKRCGYCPPLYDFLFVFIIFSNTLYIFFILFSVLNYFCILTNTILYLTPQNS